MLSAAYISHLFSFFFPFIFKKTSLLYILDFLDFDHLQSFKNLNRDRKFLFWGVGRERATQTFFFGEGPNTKILKYISHGRSHFGTFWAAVMSSQCY